MRDDEISELGKASLLAQSARMMADEGKHEKAQGLYEEALAKTVGLWIERGGRGAISGKQPISPARRCRSIPR